MFAAYSLGDQKVAAIAVYVEQVRGSGAASSKSRAGRGCAGIRSSCCIRGSQR